MHHDLPIPTRSQTCERQASVSGIRARTASTNHRHAGEDAGPAKMRIYKDEDGKPCSLWSLVKDSPEWAVNQILHRDKLEDALFQMQNAAIELEKQFTKEREKVAKLEDIIRRAATKFCEDGPDGEIAAGMFRILGERLVEETK